MGFHVVDAVNNAADTELALALSTQATTWPANHPRQH